MKKCPHRSTKTWLEDNDVTTMDWPSNTPDLNPMKNLWAILVRRNNADNRHFETVKDLQRVVSKAWSEVDNSVIINLINSMLNEFSRLLIEVVVVLNTSSICFIVMSFHITLGSTIERPGGQAEVFEVIGSAETAFKMAKFEKNIKDLKKEYEILQGLKNPNIIVAIQYINDNDMSGILLQRHKCSLQKIIDDEDEKYDRAQVKNWLDGLFSALKYLHDKGIIHADVKPSNILISSTSAAILADFGSAISFNDPKLDLALTTNYMAPEVFIGSFNDISEAYDIYGASLVVWSLIKRHKIDIGPDGKTMNTNEMKKYRTKVPDRRPFVVRSHKTFILENKALTVLLKRSTVM
uniref:Protein kinase domain-containing protein n=1 Tax=Heterorhabditis bacteriophora TaxID=37862 RepID=A0A1I7XKR2_HETBA